MDEVFDRDTALSVLKDLSKHMYVDHDLFGHKTLCIRTDKFEDIRKKYLPPVKGVNL